MMSRVLKIVLKVLGWAVAGILAVALGLVAVCVWLHATADLNEPDFVPSEKCAVKLSDSLRVYGGNTLRLNADGLWVMSVAGSAFERGEAIGKLAEDLLYMQEKAFADKLFEMVPSRRYRDFLHYFITIFNRRLGSSVPLEYRQEIKAMSTSCTHELDDFGNPYERQMQYHSAHDIGHVMQDYMLVGCTSFAAWGRESADSSLIIARNFDFYMGEEFARNKLVLFEKPDSGHAFVSVTWPGMLGVLSGMNTAGLTVTINAAKLETPSMSATPISLLTKKILQYASNLEEAWQIAGEYNTFVSESILVGSVNDGRAVIIEKTPSAMSMYDPADRDSSVTHIVCTNHYQSEMFRDNPVNAAAILRDKKGLGGEPLGYCNELAINQLLAMHSVIFRPAERKIWVSTSPWQCGRFVCYDLDDVFGADASGFESSSEVIPEDLFIHSRDFADVLEFKKLLPVMQKAARSGRHVPEDSLRHFVSLDSLYFKAYDVAGDCYLSSGRAAQAAASYRHALTLPMKPSEYQHIETKLGKIR